jgi:hypothetical protein
VKALHSLLNLLLLKREEQSANNNNIPEKKVGATNAREQTLLQPNEESVGGSFTARESSEVLFWREISRALDGMLDQAVASNAAEGTSGGEQFAVVLLEMLCGACRAAQQPTR